jgi:hypothetical protein
VPYEKKKVNAPKKKRVQYHSQKVIMPGSRNKSGTKCPIIF